MWSGAAAPSDDGVPDGGGHWHSTRIHLVPTDRQRCHDERVAPGMHEVCRPGLPVRGGEAVCLDLRSGRGLAHPCYHCRLGVGDDPLRDQPVATEPGVEFKALRVMACSARAQACRVGTCCNEGAPAGGSIARPYRHGSPGPHDRRTRLGMRASRAEDRRQPCTANRPTRPLLPDARPRCACSRSRRCARLACTACRSTCVRPRSRARRTVRRLRMIGRGRASVPGVVALGRSC